jgi:CRP-like cAMP-binding protein
VGSSPASFLQGLDGEARELLLSVATPISFVSGATLVRHADPARGAYVLRSGDVEAVVTLPGGESLTVARLGAGSVFGEMALIELGTCTATVRAVSDVDGWFIAHEDFRAVVSQRGAVAVRLQHAVTMILAEKLAALNAKLVAAPAQEDRVARRAAAASDPLAGVARMRKAPFDADGFLPRLPAFQHFSADEIDEAIAPASYIEVARGQALFTAADAARAAFVVVRGAVEIVAAEGECERRMAVLGPGQLVGFLSVLAGRPHSTHAFAREGALLLEFSAEAFRELYFGSSGASARLRHAVQASLLASIARTNRSLTRLISQQKLEAARRGATELEAAYHAQLTTAA